MDARRPARDNWMPAVRRTASAATAMTIRYLFCITPGRSGSDYLAGLPAHARNAVGVHEGVPVMNGRPMRRFNDGDDRDLRALSSRTPSSTTSCRRRGGWSRTLGVWAALRLGWLAARGRLAPDPSHRGGG